MPVIVIAARSNKLYTSYNSHNRICVRLFSMDKRKDINITEKKRDITVKISDIFKDKMSVNLQDLWYPVVQK